MESFKQTKKYLEMDRKRRRQFNRWELQQRKKLPEFKQQAYVRVQTTMLATIAVILFIIIMALCFKRAFM